MNVEFGLNIPIDTPIKSHRKGFKDCGGHSWWFDSRDMDISKYGSSYTMTELLKHKNWILFEEGQFVEVLPN